jgi:hypothetical protein
MIDDIDVSYRFVLVQVEPIVTTCFDYSVYRKELMMIVSTINMMHTHHVTLKRN